MNDNTVADATGKAGDGDRGKSLGSARKEQNAGISNERDLGLKPQGDQQARS